ncbi:glycosyltransferase [Microbacterium chocolatum]|uniref:glycosyltransferase n=1 Tax=Microbacterium aurantiacum TaxID=162393 RepID=UPI00338FE3C0
MIPPEGSTPHASFPDAAYLVLSSRLIPDLDGGFTLATLARARQLADAGVAGGAGPLLLTVDPGTPAEHARHRAVFAERGLVRHPERMRNLFDEAADARGGAADWLRQAALTPAADPAAEAPAGAGEYRTILGTDGAPVVGLPVIAGDPDWHISTAAVRVYGAGGALVGTLAGFGALYRAWLDHVVAGERAHTTATPAQVVVVCESRQLGELLVSWPEPDARIVHAIHTIHLEPPHTPDAAVNALWTRWLAVADRFDAVLWPTAAQRTDVVRRFGDAPGYVVAPHGVEVPSRGAAVAAVAVERAASRVVMLNRLAPGKRVDHAIRAFEAVRSVVPQATLDVYGEGAEQASLQRLIDDLGLAPSVRLRGRTDDPAVVLAEATVFVSTSAYEGQGLALAEALATGCPVVSYDAPYGPRELLARGGGVLVPDGDERALAEALLRVLQDAALRARLSAEAVTAARAVDPAHAAAALAAACSMALAHPARRLRG